jgi:hypothetical protein
MRLLVATLFLLTGFLLPVKAQISFTNHNDLLNNADIHSGIAMGVADMNGDGRDDIIRLDEGRVLYIELQNGDGSFITKSAGQVANQSEWSMCIADVDNDGNCDVITGGSYDNVKLIKTNPDGSTFTVSNLPNSNIFLQNSNFADINNDGWIDIFGCHDDAAGRIWGNNGDGTYSANNEWINLATVPASDNSGNYGSIWTDFDNDGDVDFYIAKCRQGVNDPTDPRRINTLYVNDGNNNYTENALEYGLKIGAQSWTADFNDIDNDGDMDCFITNHDVNSMLLENDGTGHFTDISASAGFGNLDFPLQAVMRDLDNDGYNDILVSGSGNHIFHNNGNKTFTEIPNAFNTNTMLTFATGDLNHDGFLDVYAGYGDIYTSPSNIDDVLWLNNGNDNHFFAVNLQGVESNRNGIGARITLYSELGVQIREVRAGDSYGIHNSFCANFGMGNVTQIDSVTIKWPSGERDVVVDPDVDQFITVIEGTCISPPSNVSVNGSTTFCSGSSVELVAPAGYFYEWSNGMNTQSITVTAPGNYNVTISNSDGCNGISATIPVVVDPDETPSITVAGETVFCEGGTVVLTSSEAAGYTWSNGQTTQSITVNTSGSYNVTIQGTCGDYSAPVAIEVEVTDVTEPVTTGATIEVGQMANLSATGNEPHWYDAPVNGNEIFVGTNFTTPALTNTTTYYVSDIESFIGPVLNVGPPEHEGSSTSGTQFNGQVIFDAFEVFTLKSVKVYSNVAASRQIELQNASGTVLASTIIEIPAGETTITLNFDVPVGNNLILTTNTDYNVAQLGTNSPQLYRSDNNIQYPYLIEDLVSLKNSNFGTDRYYYFYNWEVQEAASICFSQRVPVVATVDIMESAENIIRDEVSVRPNPVNGIFQLILENPVQGVVEVLDNKGAIISRREGIFQASVDMDASTWSAGIYNIRITTADKVYLTRVVKQ